MAHEVANIDKGFTIQSLDGEFGGVVLGDLYLDNEDIEEMDDIIDYFENIKYPDQAVFAADEYAVSLLCDNFTYDGLGIFSLINRMDSLSNPIDWIMDGPNDLNDRMSRMSNLVNESGCDFDFRGESIYLRFKNDYLP